MVLLQAGLGRRTLNIPENADHSQISYILIESYSKMVSLEGAKMLHIAIGGSGQRKLSVSVPEAEGYTGAYLAKALVLLKPSKHLVDEWTQRHSLMLVSLGRTSLNLRVSFIGESGIDHGALRKEFLTEMMAGVERKFSGSTGKTPKYSITDYHKEHFKTAGEIMAVSIVQGGHAPNFFRECCYGYISTGEMDRDSISKEDVTDPELSHLMEEVEIAEPEAMYDLLDRITACGYSGPATWERKEYIIKAIICTHRSASYQCCSRFAQA
ncbi:hypothetical protein CesoFtcFv8_001640 [Champsocephalus esox]|uniref:HECT domain-containing protein n=1 Tax=Champsocephalus esox TaxID=159716 RepID=A0AAN8D408_9TELE|nr:hypothetical protein CesoFtcFv8_001640 [Champsocephalus esox]